MTGYLRSTLDNKTSCHQREIRPGWLTDKSIWTAIPNFPDCYIIGLCKYKSVYSAPKTADQESVVIISCSVNLSLCQE